MLRVEHGIAESTVGVKRELTILPEIEFGENCALPFLAQQISVSVSASVLFL